MKLFHKKISNIFIEIIKAKWCIFFQNPINAQRRNTCLCKKIKINRLSMSQIKRNSRSSHKTIFFWKFSQKRKKSRLIGIKNFWVHVSENRAEKNESFFSDNHSAFEVAAQKYFSPSLFPFPAKEALYQRNHHIVKKQKQQIPQKDAPYLSSTTEDKVFFVTTRWCFWERS